MVLFSKGIASPDRSDYADMAPGDNVNIVAKRRRDSDGVLIGQVLVVQAMQEIPEGESSENSWRNDSPDKSYLDENRNKGVGCGIMTRSGVKDKRLI
jgi:hypothetical protein